MTTLVTLNTGLFHGFIAEAPARRRALVEALNELEADVVCLQEVWPVEGPHGAWSAAEIAAVIDGVSEVYPHAFAGLRAFRDEGYVCGGHHGLMTLSRHPITESVVVELPATLVARAALYTRIDPGKGRELAVFNTHLAADLSHVFPYPGGRFSSFGEEQAAQIDALIAEVEARQSRALCVLVGDFNAGPSGIGPGGEAMVAEWPQNYERILDAGFVDAVIEALGHPVATYAQQNTLTDTGSDRMLDHFFLRSEGRRAVLDGRVLFRDATVLLPTQKRTHLSDHFGLMITLDETR